MRISVANAHAMRLIDWQIQSSPHVRGTLETLAQLVFERGIIPACARDTCRVAGSPACRGDHLRMCGEHGAVVVELDCSKIPRDQLSRLEHQSGGYPRLFIPDYPRACGANRKRFEGFGGGYGSSPRVRGKPCGRFQCVGYLRIIPARARQTTSASRPTPTATDHPPVNRTPIVGLE